MKSAYDVIGESKKGSTSWAPKARFVGHAGLEFGAVGAGLVAEYLFPSASPDDKDLGRKLRHLIERCPEKDTVLTAPQPRQRGVVDENLRRIRKK